MKKAIRLMLPCALLAFAVNAQAQALFTFHIPVDMKEIPAAYSSIEIACRLKALNPYTGKKDSIPNSTRVSSNIPLVEGKVKTTVSVTFDKKDLTPEFQANPAGVTDGDCNLNLHVAKGDNGYTPGYGLADFKPGTPFLVNANVNFAAMRGKN